MDYITIDKESAYHDLVIEFESCKLKNRKLIRNRGQRAYRF